MGDRNMIGANKQVFDRLVEFVLKKEPELEIPEVARYIITTEQDKEWLKKTKILDEFRVFPGLRTASLELKESKFLVVIGWNTAAELSGLLVEDEQRNAGLTTAAISDLDLRVVGNTDYVEILDKVLLLTTEDKIQGFDAATVEQFFEPYKVYEVSKNLAIGIDDLRRTTGYFICKNSDKLYLPFSNKTVEVFEKIFLEGSTSISFESLVLSLFSQNWTQAFMEIYRCIENLFAITTLAKVFDKETPQPALKLSELSVKLEVQTGWRPQEIGALQAILENAGDEVNNLLREFYHEAGVPTDEKPWTLIYKTRNNIVHFRPATRKISYSDRGWDLLLQAMLSLVERKYREFAYAF